METSGHGKKPWSHLGPPTGPNRAPHGPPCATLALSTSRIHGSCFTSSLMRWFKSVCINGHDGVVLDPWVHCHELGAFQPTSKLTSYLNLCMCCLYNRLWEPIKALRSKGCEIKGWSTPLPRRPAPKLPPSPYLTSISTLPTTTNLGEL
jgi:hypothetical protein